MQTFAEPHFLQIHQPDDALIRTELQAGLLAELPFVAPKYFYDALGSRLFSAITELAEYYPTRTEAAVFAAHGADMARQVPAAAVMVDLGAGCCSKAARLFPLLRPAAYVAVDISVDFLRETLAQLQQRHAVLPMLGLGMDFSSQLQWPAAARDWLQRQGADGAPRCVFYPGSSIGNFTPPEALALLRQAHALCAEGGPGGGLLIGVDRVKDIPVLEAAYDDALGVTAAFNRNLLLHVNRLLGSDFAPARWQHQARFDPVASRIEMYLVSDGDQTVRWPGGQRAFVDGQRLHTENSYKWTPAAFADLLRQAGFGPATHWTDAQGWFSVFWAPA